MFLQRFGSVVRDAKSRKHADAVLAAVRTAAEAEGRSWCVMYDLSGLRAGELESVVMQDWKRLRTELKVLESPAYQTHAGRAGVAVWGIDFNDGRDYPLDDSHPLLRIFRDHPEFVKLCVMACDAVGFEPE